MFFIRQSLSFPHKTFLFVFLAPLAQKWLMHFLCFWSFVGGKVGKRTVERKSSAGNNNQKKKKEEEEKKGKSVYVKTYRNFNLYFSLSQN